MKEQLAQLRDKLLKTKRLSKERTSSNCIWQCDCGGPHYLRISRHWWDEGGAFMTVDDSYQTLSWRQRTRFIWELLRYGSLKNWGELILNPTIALEVAEELLDTAEWLQEQEAAK